MSELYLVDEPAGRKKEKERWVGPLRGRCTEDSDEHKAFLSTGTSIPATLS